MASVTPETKTYVASAALFLLMRSQSSEYITLLITHNLVSL